MSLATLDNIDPCRMPSASSKHLDARDLDSKRKQGFMEVFLLRTDYEQRPSTENCFVSLRGMKCPGTRSGDQKSGATR